MGFLVVSGLVYQAAAAWGDRRRFPPPGRLIAVKGRRWHLNEGGRGSPAVIFESGISASSLNWTNLRNRVAQITRAVSYDRAGLGWSDLADTPRVLSSLVEELNALLSAARVPPPYILAGHSFGGLLVRAYAAKFPDQVAGLVLIDPLRAGEWLQPSKMQSRMLRRGLTLCRRGALLARLGLVRLSLALLAGGARRVPRFIARLSSGRGESVISRIVGEVRKMPPEIWPMIQAHWCAPKSYLGMRAYLRSLTRSCAEAATLRTPEHLPMTILSAANATAAELAERDAMAHCSPHGQHIVAANCGHWIHLDDPELVIQAIRDMVELTRARTRL